MAIHGSPRRGAVRRNTLAACLAVALAAGGAAATGLHRAGDATRTRDGSDEAIFGGLHTTIASRDPSAWGGPGLWPAFDQPAHPSGVFIPVENCLDDGSAGSLRQAFSIAQDGDTIDLSARTDCTDSKITLTTGAIAVEAADLTVLGPGQGKLTIDGANHSRVFQSKYYGLTISDVTIANGFASNGFGGCIDINGGSDLTLIRSTVTGCRAGGDNITLSHGGAVYVEGNLTLRESTINGSDAVATDFAYGGGAYATGDVVLVSSTLSGNVASTSCNSCSSSSKGGGANATQFEVYRSTIRDNQALSISSDGRAMGGGLATNSNGSTLSLWLLNSTVSGNTASGGANGYGAGGGIYAGEHHTFALRNSTIAFNHASDRGGGAVGSSSANFHLYSSIVTNNEAAEGADIGTLSADLSITGSRNMVLVASASVHFLDEAPLQADPLLHELALNGGPTATHALDPASPAIDAGNNDNNLTFDQRGCPYARVAHGAADIGAFELQTETPDYVFGDGFDHTLLCP